MGNRETQHGTRTGTRGGFFWAWMRREPTVNSITGNSITGNSITGNSIIGNPIIGKSIAGKSCAVDLALDA
jgi:hypothetical protein